MGAIRTAASMTCLRLGWQDGAVEEWSMLTVRASHFRMLGTSDVCPRLSSKTEGCARARCIYQCG